MPPTPSPEHLRLLSPAAKLLADPVVRLVLERIADDRSAEATTAALTEHAAPWGFNARLTRERLRQLEREALVVASAHGPGQSAASTTWALSPTGRELQQTLAIVRRVLDNAVARSSVPVGAGPAVLELAFGTLADPAAARVLTVLGEEPGEVSPAALEAACVPISRRTMYRRLADLAEAGIATHVTHPTVPRTSSWELSPRWRSAASVPMLLAWWDWRRAGVPATAPAQVRALAAAVLPTLQGRNAHVGSVEWRVDGPQRGTRLGIQTSNRGAARRATPAGPEAVATADALTWLGALVAGRREGIVVTGDRGLADATLNAVRAALLTDVR